jgi:hypothetical protein
MTLACIAKGLSRQDLEMILQSFREYSERRLNPAVLLDLDASDECPESTIREMCGPELEAFELLLQNSGRLEITPSCSAERRNASRVQGGWQCVESCR